MMGARARILAKGDKHPERPEHNTEKADEAGLGGRNELGALHEEDECEADGRQPEYEQDREIMEADRLERRIDEAEVTGSRRRRGN